MKNKKTDFYQNDREEDRTAELVNSIETKMQDIKLEFSKYPELLNGFEKIGADTLDVICSLSTGIDNALCESYGQETVGAIFENIVDSLKDTIDNSEIKSVSQSDHIQIALIAICKVLMYNTAIRVNYKDGVNYGQ